MKLFHDSQLNLDSLYARPNISAKPVGKSPRLTAVKAWFGGLSANLIDALCGSQEPRIRQKIDRLGNRYYRVYDPVANAHYLFTSEEAVRVWLEQRYHQ